MVYRMTFYRRKFRRFKLAAHYKTGKMEGENEKEEQLATLTDAIGLTPSRSKESSDIKKEVSEDTKRLEYILWALDNAAPSSCFPHVCNGNQSCFEPGMVIAVGSGDGCVWPARILVVCGSLLELEWIGGKDTEFWFDASCEPIFSYPLSVDLCLRRPSSLPADVSYQDAVNKAVSFGKTVSSDWLDGNGFTLAARYRPGRKLLVLHEKDYRYFWVASIVKNIGGRLLLQYELGCKDTDLKFWLYYKDSRVYSLHRSSRARTIKPPSFLHFPSSTEWIKMYDSCSDQAVEDPIIDRIPTSNSNLPSHHGFSPGMKLEMLDQEDRRYICYGIVSVILDRNYIKVSKEENPMVCFCASVDGRSIFPIGWAKENGLKVTEKCRCCPGLRFCNQGNESPLESSPGSKKIFAPKESFPSYRSAESLGWKVGNMLEAVHPHDASKICPATVLSLHGHLIYVRLNTPDRPCIEFLVPCTSLDIFPVGWCNMFGYVLQKPAFPKFLERKLESSTRGNCKKSFSDSFSFDHPIKIENSVEIFTNHMCHAGPLLSQSRLRNLPRSIGPGPVELVLKEVLTNVINITYFTARTQRLLKHEGDIPKGHVIEILKPKSGCDSIQVSVCTEADKVSDYCKDFCKKLNCCPNLFSPVCFKEDCTDNCRAAAKRKYNLMLRKRNESSGSASMNYYKKRRRKGRKLQLDEPNDLDKTTQDSDTSTNDVSGVKTSVTPKAQKPTPKSATPRSLQQHMVLLSPRESMLQQKRRKLINTSIQHLRRRHSSATEGTGKVLQPLGVNSNPAGWNVEEVCSFLSSTSDCSSLVPLFKKQEIDGQALLLMTLPIAIKIMHLSVSDAKALCEHVIKLKVHFHRKWVPQLTGYRCI